MARVSSGSAAAPQCEAVGEADADEADAWSDDDHTAIHDLPVGSEGVSLHSTVHTSWFLMGTWPC